jgi:quinol monooxygenase YgiN
MLVVTGIIEIDESSVAAAKELAGPMGTASRAEPGCHAYAFYQDLEDPTRIRIYEEWEDQAALDTHFAMPHMAAFVEGMGKLTVKSMNVVKFEQGETSPVR